MDDWRRVHEQIQDLHYRLDRLSASSTASVNAHQLDRKMRELIAETLNVVLPRVMSIETKNEEQVQRIHRLEVSSGIADGRLQKLADLQQDSVTKQGFAFENLLSADASIRNELAQAQLASKALVEDVSSRFQNRVGDLDSRLDALFSRLDEQELQISLVKFQLEERMHALSGSVKDVSDTLASTTERLESRIASLDVQMNKLEQNIVDLEARLQLGLGQTDQRLLERVSVLLTLERNRTDELITNLESIVKGEIRARTTFQDRIRDAEEALTTEFRSFLRISNENSLRVATLDTRMQHLDASRLLAEGQLRDSVKDLDQQILKLISHGVLNAARLNHVQNFMLEDHRFGVELMCRGIVERMVSDVERMFETFVVEEGLPRKRAPDPNSVLPMVLPQIRTSPFLNQRVSSGLVNSNGDPVVDEEVLDSIEEEVHNLRIDVQSLNQSLDAKVEWVLRTVLLSLEETLNNHSKAVADRDDRMRRQMAENMELLRKQGEERIYQLMDSLDENLRKNDENDRVVRAAVRELQDNQDYLESKFLDILPSLSRHLRDFVERFRFDVDNRITESFLRLEQDRQLLVEGLQVGTKDQKTLYRRVQADAVNLARKREVTAFVVSRLSQVLRGQRDRRVYDAHQAASIIQAHFRRYRARKNAYVRRQQVAEIDMEMESMQANRRQLRRRPIE